MTIIENSQFIISNKIIINDDMLIIGKYNYEINFDLGTAIIHGNEYPIILENSNVFIKNNIYLFGQYVFNISNDLVQCAGEVFHLNEFILNVSKGRIKINSIYHSFTIENNIFLIGPVAKHIDLPINATNKLTTNIYAYPNINATYDTLQARINTYTNIIPILHINKIKPSAPSLKKLADNSQNVHDDYILAKLKNIIVDLSEKTKITKTIDDTLYEIKNYNIYRQNKNKNFIKYYWNIWFDNNCKANKIVKYIEDNNGFHPSFRMTELQVLQLVWNAIDNNQNLKEILYFNLLDMNVSNHYMCLTGRVTRMLDIFNGIEDVKIDIPINKDAIRNEMMNKCAKIRSNLSTDIIDDSKLYKKKIKDQLYIDYVDSKILTETEFNNELNEWIDHI